MIIKFYATVTVLRKKPILGGSRYMPNIRFDIPGLETTRFGLTTMDDAEWPLSEGETKLVHLVMDSKPHPGDPEDWSRSSASLVQTIATGTRFVLLEAGAEVCLGTVELIEELRGDA